MAEPFATSVDVEARWRPLSDAEQDLADTLAQDASAMIRERWGDIDTRVDDGSIATETLTRIVAQMVKRAMLNSAVEGVESHTEGAGPFSFSDKYTNPNGNLFLTSADIALLDGLGWSARSRVGWLA